MYEDVYSPSLTEGEVREVKSYDIGKLFYVGFFGGIIAMTVLGLRNAKWLGLERKYINILIGSSVVLFIGKLVIIYATTHGLIDSRYAKIPTRGLGLVCFFVFYNFLKNPFKQFSLLDMRVEPLMAQAVIWSLISAAIEGLLLVIFNI